MSIWGWRCGVGGRWRAGSVPKMPMGATFFSPNGQTGPESAFPTAERSAPCEVIMHSLVFINNSINSPQIYYGHFVLRSGKNLTRCPP